MNQTNGNKRTCTDDQFAAIIQKTRDNQFSAILRGVFLNVLNNDRILEEMISPLQDTYSDTNTPL